MFGQTIEIFVQVLLPILLMVLAGVLLQWRKPLQLSTLVTLNMYLFVPVYLFDRITLSTLSWWEVGQIGLVVMVPIGAMAIAMYLALRTMKANGRIMAAMICGGLFFNAGNFGIPVSEMAFGSEGGSVQGLIMMFMNISVFFIGYGIVALGQGHGLKSVLGFFRLPFLYVVVAALMLRDHRGGFPTWLEAALRLMSAGLVPIALVTLGAQLTAQAKWPRWKIIGPVMLLKLLVMPAITAVAVFLLGLWPWPGALIIVSSAGPTAVNTLLLSLELDGDAETAADCVFWTTVGSAVTVSIVLAVVQFAGQGQLP
ncbi:MAG: AEC family transporter [Planctomycetales bacterium]|nr:AEC family transporter [Planctomycetales bacterium]